MARDKARKPKKVVLEFDRFDLDPVLERAGFMVCESDGTIAEYVAPASDQPTQEILRQLVVFQSLLGADLFVHIRVNGELVAVKDLTTPEDAYQAWQAARSKTSPPAPPPDESLLTGRKDALEAEAREMLRGKLPKGSRLEFEEIERDAAGWQATSPSWSGELKVRLVFENGTKTVVTIATLNSTNVAYYRGGREQDEFSYRVSKEEVLGWVKTS